MYGKIIFENITHKCSNIITPFIDIQMFNMKYLAIQTSSGASCADPDSFVIGGPTLRLFLFIFFQFDERKDPNTCTTISGQSSAHQRNAIGYWLDSFVIRQGIRTSIAKKSYIFCDFQEGGSGHYFPYGRTNHTLTSA